MPEVDHRLYLLAGPLLFAVGFYSLVARAHLLRRIMAINVMGNGVFLVFIALAAQTPGPVPDPVPHAMVLTGIVVAVCATGLALALADAVQAATGCAEIAEEDQDDAGLSGGKPAARGGGSSGEDGAREPRASGGAEFGGVS